MRTAAALLVVLVLPSSAFAETRTQDPSQPFALAINAPVGWGSAVAGSVYAQLAEHHALRGNLAVYDHEPGFAVELLAASQGDGIETDYSGRTVDVGVGWQYFPRRTWSGLVFETGVLRRSEDHTADESFINSRIKHRAATGYAGRVMIGWSWLLWDHLFVAAAFGFSVGRYSGTETRTATDDFGMPRGEAMKTDIDEPDRMAGEGYLRIGVAFGR